MLIFASVFFATPTTANAEESIVRVPFSGEFTTAREALVESVEVEGLVVSGITRFDNMLERTGPVLGKQQSPYRNAEIVQFCSARLAWQMTGEDAGQMVFCPLSISVYVTTDAPDRVVFAYRSPGTATAGRIEAGSLLQRLVERAAELGRQR